MHPKKSHAQTIHHPFDRKKRRRCGRLFVALLAPLAALVLCAGLIAPPSLAGARRAFAAPAAFFSPGSLVNYATAGLSGTSPAGVAPALAPAPAANAAYTNLTRGAGLTAASATNAFNSSSWSSGATLNTANNEYYELTIAPNACAQVSLTQLNLGLERSGTGPQNAVLRASLDNFTTDIGAVISVPTTAETFTFDLSAIPALQNRAAPVTFRLYGYNAASGTATMRLTAASAPAPTLGLEVSGTVVSQAPAITDQPADQSIVFGQNASFTAAANGPAALTPQWQKSSDGGATWTNLAGANGNTLEVLAPPVAQSGTRYRAEFATACGNFYSRAATLNVGRAAAAVTLANLAHVYDGTPKSAAAATQPAGLAVALVYAGTGATVYPASSTPPTNAGTYQVTATVMDANYEGSAAGGSTIAPAAQAIVFAPLPDRTFGDAPFIAAATGGASGNPVTFTAAGNCTATPAGLVTLTAAGSCTVTAAQAGSANYNAAAPVARSFAIAPGNPSAVAVAVPSLTTRTASALVVPVGVSATDGHEIVAFTFALTYDPQVLTNPSVSQSGTLAAGYSVVVNAATPGTLVVSGTGSPLSGSGTLLNFNFEVVGVFNPLCRPITFAPYLANPVFESNFEVNPAVTIQNGEVCVVNGNVSGSVAYGNIAGLPEPPRFVPGVALTAAGSVPLAAATDAAGNYLLTGFGSGPYTITPAKTGDVGAAVSSLDATRIQQHVVGLAALTPNQLIAADVNASGAVTSLDAARVQQYVVGLTVAGNRTGKWQFIPASRSYSEIDLRLDQGGQDYAAILLGDVTGNWTPALAVTPGHGDADFRATGLAPVEVSLSSRAVAPGAEFEIAVTVSNLADLAVEAADFDVLYDPQVVEPLGAPVATDGALSAGWNIVTNAAAPGRLRISASGLRPASGDGTFIRLRFRAVGAAGSRSPVELDSFRFNEGVPRVKTAAGDVEVAIPSVGGTDLKGRLLTADGRAVTTAVVTLASGRNVRRSVPVNDFGRFVFTGVQTGETYVVTVESKLQRFSPQVVSVFGNDAELVLVAAP